MVSKRRVLFLVLKDRREGQFTLIQDQLSILTFTVHFEGVSKEFPFLTREKKGRRKVTVDSVSLSSFDRLINLPHTCNDL